MKTKLVIIVLSLIMAVSGFGCVILSKLITPANVDRSALSYAVKSGAAEPNDYNAWYSNLDEAERLKSDVDSAHTLNQEELRHLIEKDNTQYSIHKKVTALNYQTAVQREEALFGEKGLLSLGLTMAGFGGFTGLLGLMRKRSGDCSPDEVQEAIAVAQGKNVADLTEKDKQWSQLIVGMQKFVNTLPPEQQNSFKSMMNMQQDTNTQVAVSKTKKELGV